MLSLLILNHQLKFLSVLCPTFLLYKLVFKNLFEKYLTFVQMLSNSVYALQHVEIPKWIYIKNITDATSHHAQRYELHICYPTSSLTIFKVNNINKSIS